MSRRRRQTVPATTAEEAAQLAHVIRRAVERVGLGTIDSETVRPHVQTLLALSREVRRAVVDLCHDSELLELREITGIRLDPPMMGFDW